MLQTTSRDSDPQMHEHVIVANLSRGRDDGLWRTLDSPRLYDNPSAGYHLVRSEVPDGSWLLGSVWNGGEADKRGSGELVGVPAEPPPPPRVGAPFQDSRRASYVFARKGQGLVSWAAVLGREHFAGTSW